MIKLLKAFSPIQLWLYGGLAVVAVLYVSYASIRINWLKSDNAALEASNLLWESTVQVLSSSVEKQNKAIKGVLELATAAKAAAAERLKQAQTANAIRQHKISAASARIVIEHPSECATAIDDAKQELQP